MSMRIKFAAVAVAAIAIVAAAWIVIAAGDSAGKGTDSGPDGRQDVIIPEYLGDYAKYNVSGKLGLITVASGTAVVEVIEETVINGKTYIKAKCTHDIKKGNERYADAVETGLKEIPDGMSATSILYAGSDIAGTEKNMKVTVNGKTFRVDTTIYAAEFLGQPAKIWVGNSDGLVYKIDTTVSGASASGAVASLIGVRLTFTLSSTNII